LASRSSELVVSGFFCGRGDPPGGLAGPAVGCGRVLGVGDWRLARSLGQ